MSAKVAVIIGDYSNGWSDAIIIQNVAKFKQSDTNKDLMFTNKVMSEACLNVIKALEANELINPLPEDEPCCEKFEGWAEDQKNDDVKLCPFCGIKITEKRKKKFLRNLVGV